MLTGVVGWEGGGADPAFGNVGASEEGGGDGSSEQSDDEGGDEKGGQGGSAQAHASLVTKRQADEVGAQELTTETTTTTRHRGQSRTRTALSHRRRGNKNV